LTGCHPLILARPKTGIAANIAKLPELLKRPLLVSGPQFGPRRVSPSGIGSEDPGRAIETVDRMVASRQ
jgi:hypothetical protein